jgi:hypothetical protein
MDGFRLDPMPDDFDATPDAVPGCPSRPSHLPMTWRSRRTRLIVYPLAAIVFAAMSVIAVLLPSDGVAPWHIVDRVIFAMIGVVVAFVLHLLARPRITATFEGVVVVNMMRTHRLDWPQIVSVTLRPGDPWALLDLNDGDVLPVMGIQASNAAAARRAVNELRALLELFTSTERDD